MIVSQASKIKQTIPIPGDKSISHRAIMLGSLAKGITKIENFLMGDDCLGTINCFRQMGISIDMEENKTIFIHGKGLHGLQKASKPLDVGNSGTTIRILSGILSGQNFSSIISGDASIEQRPMNRIILPLRQMNAHIAAAREDSYAPLTIHPADLKNTVFHSSVASAQVKSAVLLAGLYAHGQTSVIEPALSRNHTELMLKGFGANITSENNKASLEGYPSLYGLDINIPSDISSAAFFMVAGLLVPNSEIYMENIGVNPTRSGIITVLQNMGGDITLYNHRIECGEPVCDMLVRTSDLHGTTISGDIIPSLIDELPIIAVAGCFAKGTTVIADAAELRVKECDRITAMTAELSKMGASISESQDGMIIEGKGSLHGASVESYGDHRVAMSLAIAGLMATDETIIHNSECINISFPQFPQIINSFIG
ncbi:MAG TPA: 3-phosphoshikimate 1-carboxyvinyltransferase [Epulopiscium sp.]|nr:3-phosphoshikimate 1-carboxyvinyltransferase [Candidatus Epulonipiscium sp.]